MNTSFSTEQEMVDVFINNPLLDIEIRYNQWARWRELEMNGFFGIPDVMVAYGKIGSSGQKYIRTYAFELKLRNWRRALTQAFRYAAFSHYSSVVIDHTHISPAVSNISLFQRSNIGLASIDLHGELAWHHYPKYQTPYSTSLYGELIDTLDAKLFKSWHWI